MIRLSAITGRSIVAIFLCAVLFVAYAGFAVASEPSPPKFNVYSTNTPRFENTNVILVGLQCLRPDHMGINGYKRDTTPNLDRISKESVLFENSIAQAIHTPFALMAMLTSQYPRVNGMVAFDITKEAVPARTMTDILKYYGFKTGAVISNPEFFMRFDGETGKAIDLRDVFSRSFDDFLTTRRGAETSVRVVPRESLDWIEKNKKEKFFLWIGTGSMHPPYAATVPQQEKTIYDPPGYTPFWKNYFPVSGNEGGPDDPTLDILLRLWGGNYYQGFKPIHRLTSDDAAYIASRYDASIKHTDKFVGELLDKLKKTGLDKNTIVIFYSVHGKPLGEHGRYINYDFADSIIKDLLMIRFPDGQYAGLKVPDQTQGVDILPTILSYLGIPIAADQQGIDLMPLVRSEPGAVGSEYAFIDQIPWWEHWMSRYFLEFKYRDPLTPNHPPSEDAAINEYADMLRKEFPIDAYPPGDIAIRTRQWKLVIWKDPRRLEKVSWFGFITGRRIASTDVELFDLVADPLELHNVAAEHPDIVTDLKGRLLKWDADVEKRKARYSSASEKRYIIPYP
jgi:arylsulfatase A-like enzyme